MSRLQEFMANSPAMSRLTSLPAPARLAAAAAGVALIIVAAIWMQEPDYKVLFANLADKDGGTIVTALDKMAVPYRMSENGTAILVPSDKVHSSRLLLAEQGLPQNGNVGFELMQEAKFGSSQFAEQITYQRAIEGELARSIEAMHSVASARVHLAIPKESVFVRERKAPTASVLLNLSSGRTLGDGQISAITWLVASSVPDLSVENVSVVDQTGRLLSSKGGAGGIGASATQMKYAVDLEERTAARVLSILTPILGAGNVHAEVSAEVDFNQREQTSEMYRPNQKPELAAVRSEQISTSIQRGAGPAQGVPGALSNVPPEPPAAPVNEGGPETPAPAAGPGSENNSSTVNYEVDRTISHVKESVGQIKRLSVAVVVNYRTNADGEQIPLDPAHVALIESLAKEAIGYSAARGDTLSVANAPFDRVEFVLPWWKDPYLTDMAKTAAKYVLLLLFAMFVWFKFIKPLLRGMTPAPVEPSKIDSAEDMNTPTDAQALADQSKRAIERYEEAITAVRDIANKDPRVVANVLRGWMNQND